MYNEVLKRYAEGLKELAARPGVAVYDTRTLMMEVQTRAKAADQENIYRLERELNGIFPWITPPPPEAEVEKIAFMRKLDETVTARERACYELVRDRSWEWRLVRVP